MKSRICILDCINLQAIFSGRREAVELSRVVPVGWASPTTQAQAEQELRLIQSN
jgi:hypothetical protein